MSLYFDKVNKCIFSRNGMNGVNLTYIDFNNHIEKLYDYSMSNYCILYDRRNDSVKVLCKSKKNEQVKQELVNNNSYLLLKDFNEIVQEKEEEYKQYILQQTVQSIRQNDQLSESLKQDFINQMMITYKRYCYRSGIDFDHIKNIFNMRM